MSRGFGDGLPTSFRICDEQHGIPLKFGDGKPVNDFGGFRIGLEIDGQFHPGLRLLPGTGDCSGTGSNSWDHSHLGRTAFLASRRVTVLGEELRMRDLRGRKNL